MKWLSTILEAIGAVVDKVVPVGVGSRTKFAVIACPVLGLASNVLPVVAASVPAAGPAIGIVSGVIPSVQHALCAAAPAFALAGIVRKPS